MVDISKEVLVAQQKQITTWGPRYQELAGGSFVILYSLMRNDL